MLPESPPDSSSEAYSPAQIPGRLMHDKYNRFLFQLMYGNTGNVIYLFVCFTLMLFFFLQTDVGYEQPCLTVSPEAFPPATLPTSCHFKDRRSAHPNSDQIIRPPYCRLKDGGSAPSHCNLMTYNQLCGSGLTDIDIKSRTSPDPHVLPVYQDTNRPPERYLNSGNVLQGYTPTTPSSPSLTPSSTYISPMTDAAMVQNLQVSSSPCALGSLSTSHTW